MSKRSFRAKKDTYGSEIRYIVSTLYPALHTVDCDFNKKTVKVSGVKWTSLLEPLL